MDVSVGFIFPHKDGKLWATYTIDEDATFTDLMQHILDHSPGYISEEIDKVGGNSAKILAGGPPAGRVCHHWKVKDKNSNVTCIMLPPRAICSIQGGGLIKKKKMKKPKTNKKKYKKNKTKKRKY